MKTVQVTRQLGNILTDIFSSDVGKAVTGSAKEIAGAYAGETISLIQIDTEYGPQIAFDHPLRPSGSTGEAKVPTAGDMILGLLKPQITIDSLVGHTVAAPFGTPGPTKWPMVKWVLALGVIVGGGLAVYGALQLLKGTADVERALLK